MPSPHKKRRAYTQTQRELILKTSDEIGPVAAAKHHGVPVQTVYGMRSKRKHALNGTQPAPLKVRSTTPKKRRGPQKGQQPPFVRTLRARVEELEHENAKLRDAIIQFTLERM